MGPEAKVLSSPTHTRILKELSVCANSNHRRRVQLEVQFYGEQETEIGIAKFKLLDCKFKSGFGDLLSRTKWTTGAYIKGEKDTPLDGGPSPHLDGWPAVSSAAQPSP
jgi:hypothetical protein